MQQAILGLTLKIVGLRFAAQVHAGATMPSSTLYDRTLNLVRNRSRQITFRQIQTDTGLTVGWLEIFATGKMKDPGVCKVEALYVYLTGKPLAFGDE